MIMAAESGIQGESNVLDVTSFRLNPPGKKKFSKDTSVDKMEISIAVIRSKPSNLENARGAK